MIAWYHPVLLPGDRGHRHEDLRLGGCPGLDQERAELAKPLRGLRRFARRFQGAPRDPQRLLRLRRLPGREPRPGEAQLGLAQDQRQLLAAGYLRDLLEKERPQRK